MKDKKTDIYKKKKCEKPKREKRTVTTHDNKFLKHVLSFWKKELDKEKEK